MPTRLETLEKMVALGPGDPFPYYALALEYRSAARPQDALAAFGRLRERFPDYVPQYLMAAQVAIGEKLFDLAREWLTRGLDTARRARDAHSLGELESALATLPPP